MIDHTGKVMPILSSMLEHIGVFLTSCVGKPYTNSPPSSIVTISCVQFFLFNLAKREKWALKSGCWKVLVSLCLCCFLHHSCYLVARQLSHAALMDGHGLGPIISLGQSRRKRELAFQCVSTREMLLHLWIKTLDFVWLCSVECGYTLLFLEAH